MLLNANSIARLLSRHKLLFLVNDEEIGFFEVALAVLSEVSGAGDATVRQRDLFLNKSLAKGIVMLGLRLSFYHVLESITRRD